MSPLFFDCVPLPLLGSEMRFNLFPKNTIKLALLWLLLISFPQVSLSETGIIIGVAEGHPGSGGYQFILNGATYQGPKEIMDALSAAKGNQLAVLLDSSAPVSAISDLASMASKVRFYGKNLKFFLLDQKRKGMRKLDPPDSKWHPYSINPESFQQFFR